MTNPAHIESIRIQGFRSLADIRIEKLPMATVLIGANGSGKSNVIRFFEMMSWMLGSRRLDEYVQYQGGADDLLFWGNKVTSRIAGEISIRTSTGRNDYRFELSHAHPDRFIFTEEAYRFSRKDRNTESEWQHLGSAHDKAKIVEIASSPALSRDHSTSSSMIPGSPPKELNARTARTVLFLLRQCVLYQFHDTSHNSNMKKRWGAEDNNYLRSDGGNLASILYRLEQDDIKRYERISRHISRILPAFDRFQIERSFDKVELRWRAKNFDKTIGAHMTSDGSLRFFSLVTLLNLPPEMLPNILFLDEPELGLHPMAVTLIGGMIKSLATERQVIVATQSPLLVDSFGLDEVIVMELNEGRTKIRRFDKNEHQQWLEDYATGDLWQTNLLGGRP